VIEAERQPQSARNAIVTWSTAARVKRRPGMLNLAAEQLQQQKLVTSGSCRAQRCASTLKHE
jgi:hypothetical protein